MSTLIERLERRKLAQWVAAYLAGAWVAYQVLGMLAEHWAWPPVIMRGVSVLLGVGLLACVVLAWYHGERGRQRVSGTELVMLAVLLVIAGAALALVGGTGGDGTSARGEAAGATTTASREAADPAAELPEPPPEEGSIAVLPFANLGAGQEEEYFAHGLTEELIHALAQIGPLRVAARTSSFAFEDRNLDVRHIADSLDVATILEGSVQRSGERLRVTAQLIDGETGSHLGSWRYERERGDVFQIQDDIVSDIVDRLEIRLSTSEAARFAARPTESLEAHDLYLRGLYQWNRRTGASLDSAVTLFRAALEEDPGYGLAWAGLANTYVVPSTRMPASEKLPLAKAAARRALEVDPRLAEARTALAFALMTYDWDWEGSRRAFLRAMRDDPRYPTAPQWYASWLAAQGRPQEAVEAARRAKELDPLSMIIGWSYAQQLYFAGRYESALEELERLRQVHGDLGRLEGLRLQVLVQMAREGDAAREEAAFRALEEQLPDDVPADTLEAFEDALEAGGIDSVLARAPGPGPAPCALGRLLAVRGWETRFLECVERGVESRDLGWGVVPLVADPILEPIRDEPGYRELLRRVGLAP